MSFYVKLSPNELENDGRLVTGPIWLEMDGQAFPIDSWYDFPIVILGWWLHNMRPLITKQSIICECRFMDGPYRFVITVRKPGDWAVTFIRDDIDGVKRLFEKKVDPQALISEVISAANLIIKVCKQNEWISKDLNALDNELREFKEQMRSEGFRNSV